MSEQLSEIYCEGWCKDSGGKGKFEDCTGCHIAELEAALLERNSTIATLKTENATLRKMSEAFIRKSDALQQSGETARGG